MFLLPHFPNLHFLLELTLELMLDALEPLELLLLLSVLHLLLVLEELDLGGDLLDDLLADVDLLDLLVLADLLVQLFDLLALRDPDVAYALQLLVAALHLLGQFPLLLLLLVNFLAELLQLIPEVVVVVPLESAVLVL